MVHLIAASAAFHSVRTVESLCRNTNDSGADEIPVVPDAGLCECKRWHNVINQ